MKWFRLYYEARNDAKLRSLSDAQHRVWFNLLCFAAEQDETRGQISGYDNELLAIEVANGNTELLLETLERLERLRIITIEGEIITFVNFSKRQYDKPSDRPEATRERKRKQREKERKEKNGVTNENNDTASRPVTPCHAPETETETDIYTTTPTTTRACAKQNTYRRFEQEFGRPLSPTEVEQIQRWEKDMPAPLIDEALRRAVLAGKFSFKYIDRILLDWQKNKVLTLLDVKRQDKEFEERKRTRQRDGPSGKSKPKGDSKYAKLGNAKPEDIL